MSIVSLSHQVAAAATASKLRTALASGALLGFLTSAGCLSSAPEAAQEDGPADESSQAIVFAGGSSACQTASDEYGIVANVTFGFAPQNVRDWWVQTQCNTRPAGPSACQRASNEYGIDAGVTFGFAPQSVRDWWVQTQCNTSPSLASACQTASNEYGIDAGVTFGFAPQNVRDWWMQTQCNTHPVTARTCQAASDKYGIDANVSFNFAPQSVRDWWVQSQCTTHPTVSACQTASNEYGIDANVTFGFAPQDVRDWWVQTQCNTHPAAPSACQTASDEYGINAGVTFGFAPQNVRDWWAQNQCSTHPASPSACQAASDEYAIDAGVSFGFAPQDVRDWWVQTQCNTHPARASACQTASNEYGIDAGVTFGFAPQSVRDWWVQTQCNTHPAGPSSTALVQKFAPRLRFDGAAHGYPMSAQTFYDADIVNHQTARLDNNDASTVGTGALPTYYQEISCGSQVRLKYWWFYGYQGSCDQFGNGTHNGDWENIMVTLSEDRSSIAAITFTMHGHTYTRLATRGGYEVEDATHPVVYVAKNSHASHYTQGGSGVADNCLPWEEYRNNTSGLHMDTWQNLVSLDAGGEPWMAADRQGGFVWGPDGVSNHPTQNGPSCSTNAADWTTDVPTWWHSQCKTGDRDDGTSCHTQCRPGYTDMGLTCTNWSWSSLDTYGQYVYGYDYTLPTSNVGLLSNDYH